ncbi:MAG: CooT family nickel-binding protein [Desulfurococcales archaeon]|nr:CooT family nickel-binding protein [Desulfurococcales archaeon]
MCEYKVYLNGKLAYEDIVYARVEGSYVILRDALGREIKLEGYEIVEVDSFKEKLTLKSRG